MGARGSSRGRRRALLAIAAAAVAALVATSVFLLTRGSEARSSLERFLSAWEDERYGAAGARAHGDRRNVRDALAENRDGLDGAALEAELLEFEEEGEDARGSVRLTWQVPVIGAFAYETQVPLRRRDDEWAVRWSPRVVHPTLKAGQRLGTARIFHRRAAILDRRGRRLVAQRPVVDVGVVPGRLEDRSSALSALATHTDTDPRSLRRAVHEAAPDQFVTAITLREEHFLEIRPQLGGIAGVEFASRTMPLAPTREFARALLGTVGPVTEEQLEELGEPYGPGDEVGQWGLQAAFERRLAGNADGPDTRARTGRNSSEGAP